MIIPWTSSYSPHVPVFMLGHALESKDVMGKNYKSTDINDSVLKIQPLYGVHRLASYIDSSEFWKAQVDQVYLGENLEFIPRAGGHTVVLGDFSSLDEKLNKLLIFYREGLNKVGWNKYSVINLSYKGQVVASRTGAIVRRQELKAEPLSPSEPPVNRAERIDSVDVSKAASGDSRKEEERPKESKRREKIAEEKKPKKNSVKSSEAGKEKKSAKKEAAKSGKSDKDKSGKTKKKQGNPD
jgi:cell division protein FtsQ